MKRISLVQPNYQQGPKEFNAYYLPYSVGVLWSYIQQFPSLKESYTLNHIMWSREPMHQAVERLRNDDIVAFSAYVWNKNYNYELARQLKEINPNILIIFGGPEMPHTKKDVFVKLPFIDLIVRSEGEIIFKDLLEAFLVGAPFDTIKGLTINQNGEAINTPDADRIQSLEDLPSPYLTGIFDKVMAETTGVEWNMTIETNRGCPYACTFCDWGSLTYNKVKKFSLEKVFAELEWAGKNKCGFVTFCDANFGMFVERDNLIADKLLEVQAKYGYPYSFSMAWAKDQKPEVFDIVFKIIKSPNYNQGLTVSVQSMDLDVLENIKRKNLSQHKIDKIFDICAKNNVPVYTEVILGLPGETKETWKKNLFDIFRAGNHTGINIFQAQLLENAEMNLVQRKLYKIQSVPVYDYMSGSYMAGEIAESVEVVKSTQSMPFEDMMECLIFNWFIQTFHINGLTTYIARFLNKYKDIAYEDFYEELYQFVCKDEWFAKEESTVTKHFIKWFNEGRIGYPSLGKVEIHGWNLFHSTTLKLYHEDKLDHMFGLIKDFLDSKNYIEEELQLELYNFQRNYVIDFRDLKSYPKQYSFANDFVGYLNFNEDLEKPSTYKFLYNDRVNLTFESFLENIYFGRKRNFGKAEVVRLT